jgi:hypothetical protein
MLQRYGEQFGIMKLNYICIYSLTQKSFFIYCFFFFYIYLNAYILFVPPLGQNLFCSLLWLCWRENIRDNKKDIALLLLWDKDSYTERFLVLLPCSCVLQTTLVHFYQTSSLFPGHLPIVAFANLRLLYSLLNREHINHIEVLGFLFFPCFFCVCSPFSVWSISNNITVFVLGL